MNDLVFHIDFTEDEFNYISESLFNLYNVVSKLPKKHRTSRFYVLENLVNDKFKKEGS